MQKQQTRNTYRDVENFFSRMLKRPECIYTETDSTLADTRGGGYLYYPECIWNLINTEPVKRLARIFQLGTKIYTVDNVNHTRLEHSKGCYYRTLELLQKIYSDERVQKMVDENNSIIKSKWLYTRANRTSKRMCK